MNFDALARYLDSLGEKYGLSGTDCCVMQDHKVLFRHMWGWSDHARTRPVCAQDLYNVYSCTKIITMTACMQLAERGLIALDDPVEKYIPEFASMMISDDCDMLCVPPRCPEQSDHQHPASAKITLRHLMSMTAGLSYDIRSSAIREAIRSSGGTAGTVAIAAAIAKMPLMYEPGTRYFYSLGHDIMAAVVEIASGERYSDYLQKHIFNPLELRNMYMHVPECERGRLSAQYICGDTDKISETDSGNPYRLTPNYDSGGAGLACTVDDYIRVLDALANGGAAFNGHRLLSRESIDQMRTPQLCRKAQEDFSRGIAKAGYSYGLGVRTLVDPSKSKSPAGEFGWDGAAGAYALIDPENHLSVFYAQQVLNMRRAYGEIHPTLRDLVYECIRL